MRVKLFHPGSIVRLSRRTFSVQQHISSSSAHREKPPWRIMFFGTDSFSLKHLKVLYENKHIYDKLEVTVPFKKCPVQKFSTDVGLTTHTWPLTEPSAPFDVGVIVSFGHLIPENVINYFPNGILNMHPSLLPKLRGAAPLVHTILSGEKETGVTIMDIAASRFDVGPMLRQESFTVPDNCSVLQLEDIAAQHGSRLIINCLENLKNIDRSHQQGKATYAKKLSKDNLWINWEKQTAHDIDKHFRALSTGVAPDSREFRHRKQLGLRTKWKGQITRLQNMLSPEEMQDQQIQEFLRNEDERRDGDIQPGSLVYYKATKALCVRCKVGWVGFRTIAVNKPLSALEFYNGYIGPNGGCDPYFESEENGLDKLWSRK